MEIEQITTLISSVVGAVLAIISLIVNKNPKQVKSVSDIKNEADLKAQRYFEKQCKKNKITVSKSEDVSNSEALKTPDTINL